jgi:hypothetical protein
MTTETANDTEAVKAKVTEFLTGLMKQSNLHFTDFLEAVGEACLDLEGECVDEALRRLFEDAEDEELPDLVDESGN